MVFAQLKPLTLAGARSILSRPLLAIMLPKRCCAPGQVAAVHLFLSRQLCCLLKIRSASVMLDILVPKQVNVGMCVGLAACGMQ